MPDEKIKWTEQQRRAIRRRGCDVLVTASAGTGKTAVLSERCVDIVTDKNTGRDLSNILVLTFTDAAAEQMRSRIAGQLKAEYLKSNDRRIYRQTALLQAADISTIHSFCKRLITEHFYKLGLDPAFEIIDGDEQRLLKADVLEKTIDWAWAQADLAQGLQQLFYRRNLQTIRGFPANIISLSNFLDGVVSRQQWYQRASQLAETVNPFTSRLGDKQKQIAAEKLTHIVTVLRHCQRLCREQSPDSTWPAGCEDSFIRPVVQCLELLEAGRWEKCAEQIRNFEKPRIYKPKEISEPAAEFIQTMVGQAVDSFRQLFELAVVNPDYLNKVGGAVGLQTRVLVELVKKFDRLYSQAKQAFNCLDFADLEHYALELLTEQDSLAGNPAASQTALALRRRYEYILVDEYQDINAVQQTILDALSSGDNVFAVGDVKQSIYAFRGAQPTIFLQRLAQARTGSEDVSGPLRVDLNTNFRSNKAILDFVNRIFERIMTVSLSKIDYDESARLTAADDNQAARSADTGGNKDAVELHILDEQSWDEDSQSADSDNFADDRNPGVITARQRQAAMIARRIQEMVGAATDKAEFKVYDKQMGIERDVQYHDIVILMRSPAERANDYVRILRLAGVPVMSQSSAGYFETTEITDVLCLLKVLDNPQRDIELAAVLRSPFFNVSDTELARIKAHGKTEHGNRNFYNRIRDYCGACGDTALACKLEKFLARIQQWRIRARRGGLADLIWHIYRQTGFLWYVCALPNGRTRRANLLKLHDRAIQFEGFAGTAGIPSLTRFIDFIEKLQDTARDWSPGQPEGSLENAVNIISVHKSKGLEFPVVFLAELDSPFNKADFRNECLADWPHTVGLQIIDHQANTRLSSLAYQVIAEEKLSTALAEEMRILYVAATRARQRLVLTASAKKNICRRVICSGFFFGSGPVGDWQVRRCSRPLDWILYALSDQRNLHGIFETSLAQKAVDDDLFSARLYGRDELGELSDFIENLRTGRSKPKSPDAAKCCPCPGKPDLPAKVKKSLAWRYEYGDVSCLPAKSSVTRLSHSGDEYLHIDYSQALKRRPKAVLFAESPSVRVDRRLIGSAAHLLLAQLDLSKPVTPESIEETKQKLLAQQAVTESVLKYIDGRSIIKFFQSDIGKIVTNRANRVLREWPFTFAMPFSEFSDSNHSTGCLTAQPRDTSDQPPATSDQLRATSDQPRATIIVQGVIDILVQTPQGLWVIDFKTDDITAEQAKERSRLYQQQLRLYGLAASAIFSSKIMGKWLYFLMSGVAVEV